MEAQLSKILFSSLILLVTDIFKRMFEKRAREGLMRLRSDGFFTFFVKNDITIKAFIKGDTILMCSDGLSNMIDDEEMYEIIKTQGEQAAEKLVEKANENGGYDNITAIVIR